MKGLTANWERTCLQLRHQRFNSTEEFTRGRVRGLLQIQEFFECRKQLVEPLRFNHGPWDDFQPPTVKAGYEISILFLFHNPLKLRGKPSKGFLLKTRTLITQKSYSSAISALSAFTTSLRARSFFRRYSYGTVVTLMIMISIDWKREGIAAGSRTDALDWND